MLETMSDQEAADRLGFHVRRLRPIIDQLGLCLRLAGNGPRRLTAEQFAALKIHLTRPPCPSTSKSAPQGYTVSGGATTASPLTEALELANQAKQIKSARKSNVKSLNKSSLAKPRLTALPRLLETTCSDRVTENS
jgi:hypothetical protein